MSSNRSHPPSLKTNVLNCLKNEIQLASSSHLLLGVSGGSDSMALLAVLAHLSKQLNFKLTAIGINHNLRAEAKDELDLAENFANKLNISFIKKDVYLNKDKGSIQEQARDARYEAIRTVKKEIGADWIVTAHHANDRAETVLMRLLHGKHVQCLDVLPAKSFDLLRPMINCPKATVMKHIEKFNIPYMDDPSNMDVEKYLRSEIRHEILPRLIKINPNLVSNLCSMAKSVSSN